MKEIVRKDLASLRLDFIPLSAIEMKRFVGGSGGDWDDGVEWVTWDDFCNCPNGTWKGGWVYGLGYVGPDVIVYGSYGGGFSYSTDFNTVVYSLDYFLECDKWYGGFVEGLGYQEARNNAAYHASVYSLDRMISCLTLQAENTSTGYCARSVRKALEAGGMRIVGPHNYAYNYLECLPEMGFYEINAKSPDYKPKPGDIVVHNPVKGHESGHIAMYNGSAWISDFVQKDIYGGSAYRQSDNYKVFRYNY